MTATGRSIFPPSWRTKVQHQPKSAAGTRLRGSDCRFVNGYLRSRVINEWLFPNAQLRSKPNYDQSQWPLFIDEAGNIGSLRVLGDFEPPRCIFTTFYGRRGRAPPGTDPVRWVPEAEGPLGVTLSTSRGMGAYTA
jgi:hypothetical protein